MEYIGVITHLITNLLLTFWDILVLLSIESSLLNRDPYNGKWEALYTWEV